MSSTLHINDEINMLISCVRMIGIEKVAGQMGIERVGLNNSLNNSLRSGRMTTKLVCRIDEALKSLVGTYNEPPGIERQDGFYDDGHDPDVMPLVEAVLRVGKVCYVSVGCFEEWFSVYLELTKRAQRISSKDICIRQALFSYQQGSDVRPLLKKIEKRYSEPGIRSHTLNAYLVALYDLEREYGPDKAIKMVCVLAEE